MLASLASTVFPDFESFKAQLLDKINSKCRKWYTAALKDGQIVVSCKKCKVFYQFFNIRENPDCSELNAACGISMATTASLTHLKEPHFGKLLSEL